MTRTAKATYRLLLRCYPAAFREEYGSQMELAFAQQLQKRGASAWVEPLHDVFTVAPTEHFHTLLQDLRYALRSMASSPRFAIAAILSLAIGIGANTAIYSLWNNLLHAPLPAVREPEQLVILTDPTSSGQLNGSTSGDRDWLTYTEFVALQGNVDAFSDLMASQATLDRWDVRASDGTYQEMRGRLVSNNYFDVLGVAPILGRGFHAGEDGPYAVISYDAWQRRWNGRMDILGQRIQMRGVDLTIVGVAPQGFIGETVGQQSEAWVPLAMQPKVILGEDRLHDTPPAKSMWLHAFGRLKPGATIEQASAQSNAIFKRDLESYYASESADRRSRDMDQNLHLRPAVSGASSGREQYATVLTAMLGAVAILLVIACANLTNLMLARGTARRAEIALRLSLGASRARLFRQSIVESATLAVLSGAAGLAMAGVLHGLLLRVLSDNDRIQVAFALNGRMLLFTFGIITAVTLFLGVLPAWQATRANAGDRLKEQTRSVTNRVSGRLLVALQIALCLPLLVCAGLFVRTLQNLQGVDLGYPTTSLLQVSVNTRAAGYEPLRRDALMAGLLAEVRQIPGVASASFSHNGVFTGTNTGNSLRVDGFKSQREEDTSSEADFVAPDYFTTLKVPIVLGRAITDGDENSTAKRVVVNETFVKHFYNGRNPIGQQFIVEAVAGDVPHEIVGVVKDFRTQPSQLRRAIRPRYIGITVGSYVGMRLRTNILIRVRGEAGPVLAAVRNLVERADPTIPIMAARPVEESIDPFFRDTRSMAQLALMFGIVALLLAATGLYGVLSYGIARRTREIAIRMALGARPKGVTGMIVRETSWVVAAGLTVGAGLAYGASRFVTSELFGVTPHDPITASLAIGTLLAAALVATLWPSYRASRLDPMIALRQE